MNLDLFRNPAGRVCTDGSQYSWCIGKGYVYDLWAITATGSRQPDTELLYVTYGHLRIKVSKGTGIRTDVIDTGHISADVFSSKFPNAFNGTDHHEYSGACSGRTPSFLGLIALHRLDEYIRSQCLETADSEEQEGLRLLSSRLGQFILEQTLPIVEVLRNL